MNFIKRIFSKKSVKSSTVEEVKAIPDEEIKITVPEPKVTESVKPTIKDEYNTFNVIRQNNTDNLYYRLVSDNASEIFRMYCTEYVYKFDDLRWILPLEVKNKFEYEQPYVIKEDKWHFIIRIFITSKGRYFYQVIYSNGMCDYTFVNKQWIQSTIKTCESNNKVKVLFENCNDISKWVSDPGTYTFKEFNKDVFKRNKQVIDSFEIINKQLYDEIIEVL